jgi:cysteine desulfurase
MSQHATTPVDLRVLETMRPDFSEKFGNAASCNRRLGWQGDEAIEKRRPITAEAVYLVAVLPRQASAG